MLLPIPGSVNAAGDVQRGSSKAFRGLILGFTSKEKDGIVNE